ncbi:2,4-dienoyl-CoA reductase-like NADH-dependent reductase (Old Yellow Enzyme family) [Aeromicrobium panaciterrae]|uniref:2,4-dienoyl-CoA reductase-like NADH-dependent reductase (Old Yellow Enzyme family) n=1 Tax=Aeromicrobium panaciterrae TaxID=363861 RepID=A0ABU1UMD9_9ACTN|nr:NADH:flavin oxidoreductase [Aeromicrobium panaciterrae]MDR7086354.1 2,4-dienoyl-CoA reductase-like NADH-dependent reductase (Old Yellow Enzyme family) [Aeromicrobium panaciterrae]
MVNNVFEPATLGPIQLRNRTVKAATFEGRTPDSLVTDELIDYHLAPARGGVGLTTVAYLAIAPEGRTQKEVIVVNEKSAPGLQRLTDAIHETGAKIAGQLGHAGPVANGRSNGVHAIAASKMPSPLSMQMIKSATAADITRVTKDYVRTARIMVDAGFDVLEIHMAHGYLLSSFLAPKQNRRKDGWGGSLENRAKFARDVARVVREEVGDAAAVTAKIGMTEGSPAGFSMPETLEFAQMLEADGHLDALELSAGSSLLNPMYLFRGDVPLKEFAANMPAFVRFGLKTPMGKSFFKSYPFEEAYLREKALAFREGLSMPLIMLGGINDKATMDRAMEEGFEFVAMGRALLREPDLINRMQAGETTQGICIHCNQCMPTIYSGTRCTVLEPTA